MFVLMQCVEAATSAQPAAAKAPTTLSTAASNNAYLPRKVGEPKKLPITAAATTSSLRLTSALPATHSRVAAQKPQAKKGQQLHKKVQVVPFTSSNEIEP